ncbi:MAG: hypothetical protein MPJ50_00815 [Pirellulales bacterium]|nr:hypothetical protein [Pirellulales bacterium]
MQRKHGAWVLAAVGLLSCLLATAAEAQSNSGRVRGRRASRDRSTHTKREFRPGDLFEITPSRRQAVSFQQDAGAPPAPADLDVTAGQPLAGEVIGPGHALSSPEGHWSEGPHLGYGEGYYDDCGCGEYGCGTGCDSYGCGTTCGYFRWWDKLSVFSGVQGFRGPVDVGMNSNFGFNQGVNFASALFPAHCIGGQVGFRTTQTNLDGNSISGVDGNRDQTFLTAGLFSRGGWLRGGAVVDILNDDYYADFDINQVRAELSMLLARGGEFGVWTAVSGDSDEAFIQVNNIDTVWSPIDQYAFFYRRELCNGGNYRIWGGFTSRSDGIFGSELMVPFSNRLAFNANFNYLIPDESQLPNYQQEAWNIGIGFVWYPGGKRSCGDCGAGGLYDAMFRVADNGTFLINRRDRQQNN